MAAGLPLEVTAYGVVVLTAFREVDDAMANEQLLAQRLPLDESQVQDRSEAVGSRRCNTRPAAVPNTDAPPSETPQGMV